MYSRNIVALRIIQSIVRYCEAWVMIAVDKDVLFLFRFSLKADTLGTQVVDLWNVFRTSGHASNIRFSNWRQ